MMLGSAQWTQNERKVATNLTVEEREEVAFPATHHVEWLNEHVHEIFRRERVKLIKALKTPGRLRGRTPGTYRQPLSTQFAPKFNNHVPSDQNLPLELANGFQLGVAPVRRVSSQEPFELEAIPSPVELEANEPLHIQPARRVSSPGKKEDPELEQEESPKPDPFELPSDIATDDLNASDDDDDDDDNDDDPFDTRAPELKAHFKRVKAYESPEHDLPRNPPNPPTPVIASTSRAAAPPANPPTTPQTSPQKRVRNKIQAALSAAKKVYDRSAPTAVAARILTDENEYDNSFLGFRNHSPAAPPGKGKQRAVPPRESPIPTRAPPPAIPKPLGRPVRPLPSTTNLRPAPLNIKINAISQRMPMNTAPVAAHNQEQVHGALRKPDLKRKASAQSLAPPNASTQRPHPSSLAIARVMEKAAKKKQQDEEKAQKDAEKKKHMREQRHGTREQIVRKSSEEELRKDEQARESSAEKLKKYSKKLDQRDVKRVKLEERQEREEAVAAKKKEDFRKKQQERVAPRQQVVDNDQDDAVTHLPQRSLLSAGPLRPLGLRVATNNRPAQVQQAQIPLPVQDSPVTDVVLPEINTDTDSEGEAFQVPAWVEEGALHDILRHQEIHVNPDRIFNRVAPIDLNEVFPRNNMHKMHARTSSVNWRRHGDALTRAEIDEDIAARRAIRNRGGWEYNPQ